MVSYFRGTLDFFGRLGIYDVVLPFILIFTIVFAILEKTRVLGTEKIGEEMYTRKNLNAMIAFISAFFVVASARLVASINEIVAHSVMLLLLSVLFIMLAGSFHKDEEFFLSGGWEKFFMGIMIVGIILIFLNALGWLETLGTYMKGNWDSNAVAAIILLIIVVLVMMGITKRPTNKSQTQKNKEGEKNE